MSKRQTSPSDYRARLRSEAKNLSHLLTDIPASALEAASGAAALSAFQRAAKRVPAYRKLLKSRRLRPQTINSISQFAAKVPLVDKEALFCLHGIADLCVDGSVEDISTIYTSSGFSKQFSWGVETAGDEEQLRANIDLLLEWHFGAARRKTLLINALPMGVKVPARLPIVLDTGPRADACLAAVKMLGPHVEQVVLVGEHPFLKKMIEEGASDPAVNWPSRRVFVVTGGEWVACHYAKYVGALLGHDPKDESRGHVMVNLGVSEVGLSVGIETAEARRVRAMLRGDAAFRGALLGDSPFVPVITQFMPQRFYIESPKDKEGVPRLAVTTLDPARRLPLVRYTTGDWARVIPHGEMAAALSRVDRAMAARLSPLPFIAMWGRGRALKVGRASVFPEQVKEAIYADAALAGATTGDFRMKAVRGGWSLRIQLAQGVKVSARWSRQLEAAITAATSVRPAVTAVPFNAFAEGLDVGYQRKFRYLG